MGDEAYTQMKVQQYLDDVSRLDIPPSQTQWYNVDVANMIADTQIKGHEVDESTGASLLFLERSCMLCCAQNLESCTISQSICYTVLLMTIVASAMLRMES